MLKDCRHARNLRQREVGSLLGRDQALVSKVESGERRLDVIELREWLLALEADFVGFAADLDERIREATATRGSVFPRLSVFSEMPPTHRDGTDGRPKGRKKERRP
jgi:transcriptional regulator with XRE-family HTH domain